MDYNYVIGASLEQILRGLSETTTQMYVHVLLEQFCSRLSEIDG